ncbi:unnamed protein product [Coffea canephora]|uniref:Disease resistance R13L4/SHOC-2-like LRR domain-containing protein n=1 Tax=Coffea canephora TaxID=49390 RepID=A0A068VF65_COFCA|nr:unnamed protein product [Coffea canephora]
MDGAPGSVILVTTRSHRVATAVGSTDTHQMTQMSDSDCWLIMQRRAFAGKSGDLCKKVERIGQQIAKKCKGLPLAAKTIGSLLRFKDTVQQWQNMHDIVHDFAQFLTKNECHALDGTGRNSSSERPRHLTILKGIEEEMFSSRVVDFERLRSFLTFFEIGRVVVPQNLFCRLKCVRTLTLCGCGLAEIPAEITRLIHLRYLDLSMNPFVTLSEAVCDLYYLETLDIIGYLSEDDEEVAVSIMPSLEELEIYYCEKLETLPHRILSKISSLKNLNIRGCSNLTDKTIIICSGMIFHTFFFMYLSSLKSNNYDL